MELLATAVIVLAFMAFLWMPQEASKPSLAPETKLNNPQHVYRVPPPSYAQSSVSSSQLGTLTAQQDSSSPPIVLPLMGRESLTRRSRWHYHTFTDTTNKQPLSVWFNNRDCMQEVGCDEIMQGDSVQVKPYNTTFETYLFSG